MKNRETSDPYRLYRQLFSMYGKQNWWPAKTKFEVIVGAILAQQTSWRNVELAIRNLRRRKLLTMQKLANSPIRTLETYTYSTGFYRQKARRIKNVTRHILSKTGGNLNRFLEKPLEICRTELLDLDGIGKETADSILLYAGNKLILPIDAYTLRVITRVMKRKGDYESIHAYIQEALPREVGVYKEFHALVVEHAKKRCFNAKPNCANCRVDPCLYESLH
jgi:endonuclease-3 related protein